MPLNKSRMTAWLLFSMLACLTNVAMAVLRVATAEEVAALRKATFDELGLTKWFNMDDLVAEFAPKHLRLAFHDAGTFGKDADTGGANGSLEFEFGFNANNNPGLPVAWEAVKNIAAQANAALGRTAFSIADTMAFTPGVMLELMGGGGYLSRLKVGRVDAVAADDNPDQLLPGAGEPLVALLAKFARMGLSTKEMVVLSGSHTIGRIGGVGGRGTFDNSYFRTLVFPDVFTNGQEPMMPPYPRHFRNRPLARLRAATKAHLRSVANRKAQGTWVRPANVGLPSDRTLLTDNATAKWVRAYATSNRRFKADFRNAYVKMTELVATSP